jgi:insertion element IS1 protein InsB
MRAHYSVGAARDVRLCTRSAELAIDVTKMMTRFVHVHVADSTTAVSVRRLEAAADEMCSVVGKRANKPWIWLAMDAKTRQVIACHVGDRSRHSAEQLWANIPAAYREQARFYMNQDEAYTGVIPAAQHKAITKQARKTNHSERFNTTLRQRVSRLGRETLAFSKKLANHSGALKYFICSYNLTRAAALQG